MYILWEEKDITRQKTLFDEKTRGIHILQIFSNCNIFKNRCIINIYIYIYIYIHLHKYTYMSPFSQLGSVSLQWYKCSFTISLWPIQHWQQK